ncbi:protein-export membrane protein SecF [Denitrovibrio acetiphilus DSM 12809]|uniref:Protein-export membrane protein SecF n=1 Tax=Denitrovibrio acetiphilus (strain DSM 12809 / NBRC 114555 / N2460) TaxID=522772 RepID=D4H482_DENA2|nr:protein translocase subunit SecF [Denitrovibrio acetiphilus]ADD69211.1 protein-export membrane protein SecF [Denitrovibrio acetiphilus DSM 12809]
MFELIKTGTQFDFMSKTKIFFVISGLVFILSLGIVFTKGFNFGIDFAGGTIIQMQFSSAPDVDKIRSAMDSLDIGEVVIQNFGAPEEILIRVEKTERDLNEVANTIKESMGNTFPDNEFIVERVEQVGPQVGADLKSKATYAVLYSLIGVLIYVAFRFQLIFAVGAVLAISHDVVITLGIFSIAGKEITLTIIAALLTIVGYSLNDTIVVFDRIRENMQEDKTDMDLKKLINKSLNETLSRTVLTSLTTLLAVGSLYLFGGEVINGFAFALLMGIVVGTYSSIGIASAFVYVLTKKKREAKAA